MILTCNSIHFFHFNSIIQIVLNFFFSDVNQITIAVVKNIAKTSNANSHALNVVLELNAQEFQIIVLFASVQR